MPRASRRGAATVTMADVAARAGVSAMTVSNVINETGRVSDATTRKVRAAIDTLGYRPDPAARHLASAGASRLGVIYKKSRSAFISEALVSALDAASARGVQLLTLDCAEHDVAQIDAALRRLVQQGARSLLLMPPFAEQVAGRDIAASLGVPVAAIGTGRAFADMITVRIDERAAAATMTEFLIAQGHRRIGFVAGPASHSGAIARRAGFEQAMAAHGLAIDATLMTGGDYEFASGLAAGRLLLERPDPPSAIFASNDDMAAAIAWVAHSLGLRMPHELAVAGFDDSPIATRVFPALSAIRQPVGTIATQATERLIAAMRGNAPAARDLVVPFELVTRQSTDVPRL
jgi:LacI family transcriptional regulator